MTGVVVVCSALFGLGLYGVLSRREIVGILASVEIMLAAANILLVGLSRTSSLVPGTTQGASAEAVGLVVVVVAAAEAAVGLSLLIAAVRRTGRQTVEEFMEVRG